MKRVSIRTMVGSLVVAALIVMSSVSMVGAEGKVFYGVNSGGWSTGIAVCNSSDFRQGVYLSVGSQFKTFSVAPNSCETFMVQNRFPLAYGTFPIAYSATEDVGVTVIVFSEYGAIAQN